MDPETSVEVEEGQKGPELVLSELTQSSETAANTQSQKNEEATSCQGHDVLVGMQAAMLQSCYLSWDVSTVT